MASKPTHEAIDVHALIPDPLIGAEPNERNQEALVRYRLLTSAESGKFRIEAARHWKDSASNSRLQVVSARWQGKRRNFLDHVDLFASGAEKLCSDSIIARCQISQHVPGLKFEWVVADVRADLAIALGFEADPPKRNANFYLQLTKSWMDSACEDFDVRISQILDGVPAWAAYDDGRTVAQKFESERKRIRSSSQAPEVKEMEIANLDRIEKNGRCTPEETQQLRNHVAGELHSAIEWRAVPNAGDYLESLPSVDRLSERRPPLRPFNKEADFRKFQIASIKAERPGISSRNICVEIDRLRAEGERRGNKGMVSRLQPLPSWLNVIGNDRATWLELYNYSGTKNKVKTYIDKIRASRY